jgi:hypothetical protein
VKVVRRWDSDMRRCKEVRSCVEEVERLTSALTVAGLVESEAFTASTRATRSVW